MRHERSRRAEGIARLLAGSRQPISPLRQSEGRLRTFALDLGPSTFVPPRAPGYAQLVTLRRGAALLRCGGARVTLTPAYAAWVPERSAYALELHTRCELRVLYAEAQDDTTAFAPVIASSLLVELIERSVVAGYLDPSNARHSRLSAVIDDELGALVATSAAHTLVSPRDPHLLAAVSRALEDRDDVPTIAALAGLDAHVTANARTPIPARNGPHTARMAATRTARKSHDRTSSGGLGHGCGTRLRLCFSQCFYRGVSQNVRRYAGSYRTTSPWRSARAPVTLEPGGPRA